VFLGLALKLATARKLRDVVLIKQKRTAGSILGDWASKGANDDEAAGVRTIARIIRYLSKH